MVSVVILVTFVSLVLFASLFSRHGQELASFWALKKVAAEPDVVNPNLSILVDIYEDLISVELIPDSI